jgi:hypothetical protein
MAAPLRIEYVEARKVLLDVLETLRDHLDALVIVGAQAVYLRTEGRLPMYQAFTTDADVVIDPDRLGPIPPLGDAMRSAGFVLTSEPGVWEAHVLRSEAEEIVVPIDLIVPEHVAPKAGRRSARLAGQHGKATARKSAGLEGALVDNGPIEIAAFDPEDPRRFTANVAGPAALFVAKCHKLGERMATPQRLDAKDAGDVYRVFDIIDPTGMAALLRILLADERSAEATRVALAYAGQLFDASTSTGTALAIEALATAVPADTVAAVITGYLRDLVEHP